MISSFETLRRFTPIRTEASTISFSTSGSGRAARPS
jgi:hypothetical protein